MQIKVVFDKDSIDKNFHRGWGLSFLVEERILFDTGEKGKWLLNNLEKMKVDIDKIDSVVISHDRWDHWGGLWDLLKKKGGIKVYILPHFTNEFKEKAQSLQAKLIENTNLLQLSKDIFIIGGDIYGKHPNGYIPEQVLILRTKNGLTIISGCARQGVLKIIEKVKRAFPSQIIYLMAGGFHLINSDKRTVEFIVESFKKMGVVKVGPTHCSGSSAKEIFQEKYGNNFIFIKAGVILNV